MVTGAADVNGQRKGVWEPLPLIVYGHAIHPLSPSGRDARLSHRTRLSTVTEASNDENALQRDVVSLEFGDKVYAFEKYTPKGKEVEGVWYRGYVVCAARRPPVTWLLSSESSSSATVTSPIEANESQVFIGIFPASHVHVRDQVSDAEGRLPDLVEFPSNTSAGTDQSSLWKQGRITPAADGTRESEDSLRKSFRLGPPPDQAKSSRAGLPVYSASIRSSSPDTQVLKVLPPRPSEQLGDVTASGETQPIIDEIASALREWHMMMFQYLARRDYKLFRIVWDHIEALHLGRRQLLAQTLSAEETTNLRRECVARLVSGNVVQGLDIIVRHPTWGSLVTVDVEGEVDPRSWFSGVRMYAMQTSLAYMNVAPETNNVTKYIRHGPDRLSFPLPTPAHSAFPELTRKQPLPRSPDSVSLLASPSFSPSPNGKPAAARFYHVFLDLRAFVASPCAPGETSELFFSLYKHSESPSFITEEFCVVLNHNGVSQRDPSARIRTLFVDLAGSDGSDPIYLVCRVVRNGALKLGSSSGTAFSGDNGRRASETSLRDETTPMPAAYFNPRGSFPADPPIHYRRPFGCAVLELTQLRQMMSEQSDTCPTREHVMPIFVPTNEALFSMLHQDIIDHNVKEFEKSSRAEMLAVSIKVFYGELHTIVRENTSLLQDVPLTLRLGFPDVVFPGDMRNELYIKLWSGDFSSSHSGSARLSITNIARGGPISNNVQVTIEIRDDNGKAIENAIFLGGSGEPCATQFRSMVFLRNNQPTFGELIKLRLPLHGLPQWHLFFTFRNRPGREKSYGRPSEVMDRPFAFAFLPLFPGQGAFLGDGSHTLVLYRADRLNQIKPDMYLGASPWLLAGQKLDQVNIPIDLMRIAPPLKDTITIRSSLCSTKFTQNPVLLSLLNWQQLKDPELLPTVLTKFTFVGEGEIVKFLRDIFDSLFDILLSHTNQSGDMDHLVFNALVTVLGIVQDRRFSNFQPVLDVYIEEHFTCAAAYSRMIRSINRLLRDPTTDDNVSPLRAALKVWHYILKFIARSRELQRATELGMGFGTTAEHLEVTFKREVSSHLSAVNKMMATTSPSSIILTQTIAVQHFTSILPELAKIFKTEELVTIATTFANSILPGRGQIVIWKLIMYLQIVKGFLFDNPQSRTPLVVAVVIWIKAHFGRYDEFAHTQPGDSDSVKDDTRIRWLESVRLCVSITAVMLDKLQQQLVLPEVRASRNLLRQEQDNVEYLLTLLPRLLDSYREFVNPINLRAFERSRQPSTAITTIPVTFPESYPFSLIALLPNVPRSEVDSTAISDDRSNKIFFNPGLGEIAVVLLVLILSSPTRHIFDFLKSSLEIEGAENFSQMLLQFFKVATSVLENDAFPSHWLNVNILAHKVFIKMMDPIETLMKSDFIPPRSLSHQFNSQLWREGFHMLLKLLSSDQLVIEEFNPQKRRAVWRLGGDIRGEGADILLRLWEALRWGHSPSDVSEPALAYRGYQIFLSSHIGPVVNICLSRHDQLRSNAVQILFGMIVSEYQRSNHFDQIENELVSKLDSLFMSDSKGDDVSRASFIAQLKHLFDTSDVDEHLRERIAIFLESVDLFLKLLLSVRRLPEGEEFADDRVIATLRLMNFIRRIGRDEIYIKYVHQLVNMHLQSQNYVEAALTLKLHSDLYDWDLQSFLTPMEELGLPQQTEFHRKETLCLLVLDYLGKGKAYESAIEICKELATQHAEITFNYTRLSEILRHQASLLEHVISDQRYYPDYFKVAFYGNFPDAIRNKQFIFRGYEWEKFGAFCERMINQHPGAQLLKSAGEPPVDIRFGNDQFIQCSAVVPEPNRSLPVFINPDVPTAVRSYYEHSAIDLFSSSRQLVKLTPDGAEEIWLEKTYVNTEDTFPTVLRRSEITGWEIIEISPIEIALNDVESKTRELATLNIRFSAMTKATQYESTNLLSMSLNTAVDGPLESGIPSFRRIYLDPSYTVRFPDRVELVEKLRSAIDDQVHMIDSCLKLHGHLCPPEMLPFHETLEKFFQNNFSEEIQRLSVGTSEHHIESPTALSHLPHASQYHTPPQRHSFQRLSHDPHQATISTYRVAGKSAHLNESPLSLSLMHADSSGMADNQSSTKQTQLQRHLAHLAQHGMNGVASGPRDHMGSDSGESRHESFVTVGNGTSAAGLSGASVTASNLTSSGSFRGRFSRLGSLNFGRRAVK